MEPIDLTHSDGEEKAAKPFWSSAGKGRAGATSTEIRPVKPLPSKPYNSISIPLKSISNPQSNGKPLPKKSLLKDPPRPKSLPKFSDPPPPPPPPRYEPPKPTKLTEDDSDDFIRLPDDDEPAEDILGPTPTRAQTFDARQNGAGGGRGGRRPAWTPAGDTRPGSAPPRWGSNNDANVPLLDVDPSQLQLPVPPWVPEGRVYSEDPTKMLNEEISDYISYILPTPHERRLRLIAMARCRELVRATWRDADVAVFGSFETGIYLPSSDLDLVVVSPSLTIPQCLRTLAERLQFSGIGNAIEKIEKARVPIVKYKDSLTGIPIDISFNQMSGLDTARIVKAFVDDPVSGPAVKPLVLLIKQFLQQRGLNEVYSGGLGSYAVTVMVVAFLRMHPYVNSGVIVPEENLGVLLLDFLELFGRSIDYDQVAVAVTQDGEAFFISKRKLPPAFSNPGRGGGGRGGGGGARLALVDPGNPENDISGGSFMFHLVKTQFLQAFQLLTCTINKQKEAAQQFEADGRRNKHVSEPRRGKHGGAARLPPPRLPTLLSFILRMRRATEEKRAQADELWRRIEEGEIDPRAGAGEPGPADAEWLESVLSGDMEKNAHKYIVADAGGTAGGKGGQRRKKKARGDVDFDSEDGSEFVVASSDEESEDERDRDRRRKVPGAQASMLQGEPSGASAAGADLFVIDTVGTRDD